MNQIAKLNDDALWRCRVRRGSHSAGKIISGFLRSSITAIRSDSVEKAKFISKKTICEWRDQQRHLAQGGTYTKTIQIRLVVVSWAPLSGLNLWGNIKPSPHLYDRRSVYHRVQTCRTEPHPESYQHRASRCTARHPKDQLRPNSK
jgi:hypothetical protein